MAGVLCDLFIRWIIIMCNYRPGIYDGINYGVIIATIS